METKLYYTTPSNECFNEVKDKSIEIWGGYDDEFGYATEKIGRIKDIENISDNLMHMVAMFDNSNQRKLANLLSEGSKSAIKARLDEAGVMFHPF